MKLLFKVVPPRTRMTPSLTGPTLLLEQDLWNDYSFQTQYHVSYCIPSSDGQVDTTLVGAVKILRKGQTSADGLQINDDFESLDQNYCSVGQSLDYYERIRELGEVGRYITNALRDVIAQPDLVDQFQSESGWDISLFRDQKDRGARFRFLATGLLNRHYEKIPTDQQSFTFSMSGWKSPVVIDTTSGEEGSFLCQTILPERINILVGRNGSGKSTLLARLARVAFGSPTERTKPPLSDLGTLEPEAIGFPRIVTVAFSPFDSFRLPGSDVRNRVQIAKDMQRGVGRFSFIGLRDFLAEVGQTDQSPTLTDPSTDEEIDDRVAQTKLKAIAQLTNEFIGYRHKIVEKGRQAVLKAALGKLERGLFRDDWVISEMGTDEEVKDWFHRCSTGHKITLLVVFGLVANLEPYSLVLFDEPETHLHPPLLSAMMHALRGVLQEYEASAVIATHSPVVVQESLARHVHVVRREGDQTAIVPVSTETFGESIGIITAQVFGMESNATDFHKVLDGLISRYKTLEDIEALFMDGVMSHQARAYILGRLSDKSGG